MNINRIIVMASLAAVLISGSAVIVQAVHKKDAGEHVGTLDVAAIEAEIQDKAAADAKIAELKVKADIQEEYAAFLNYYESISDLNDNVAKHRAALKTDMADLLNISQVCNDKINAFDSVYRSQAQRRIESEILGSEQCFADIQTVIDRCNLDRTAVETSVADYNTKKAKEAKEAAEAAAAQKKEKEKKDNGKSGNNSGSSSGNSNSSGSNKQSGGSSGGKKQSGGSSGGSSGSNKQSGGSSGGSSSSSDSVYTGRNEYGYNSDNSSSGSSSAKLDYGANAK